jgi:hypothetical protein
MDELDQATKIRLTALDRAITSGSGGDYTNEGFSTVNTDRILEAAKKFEAYLKGENNV